MVTKAEADAVKASGLLGVISTVDRGIGPDALAFWAKNVDHMPQWRPFRGLIERFDLALTFIHRLTGAPYLLPPDFQLEKPAKPTLFVVGDDPDWTTCTGPAGFDPRLLDAIIKYSSGVVIVSSGPEPGAYITAVTPLIFGKSGMLIETRLEREADWAHRTGSLPQVICTVPIAGTA